MASLFSASAGGPSKSVLDRLSRGSECAKSKGSLRSREWLLRRSSLEDLLSASKHVVVTIEKKWRDRLIEVASIKGTR